MTAPSLLILAGPNGCGKTTIAEFMAHAGNLGRFLNADLIARGLESKPLIGGQIESGRILLQQLHSAIDSRASIAFESTLSGRTWIRLLGAARDNGFEITICYVAVRTADVAVARVTKRIAEGGHAVPEKDIRRRYVRSLELFWKTYRPQVDNWYFFDNSGVSALLVAYKEGPTPQQVREPDLLAYYQGIYGD
jgi:predicted ABC-type ATPase